MYYVAIAKYSEFNGLNNYVKFFNTLEEALTYAKQEQENFVDEYNIPKYDDNYESVNGEDQFLTWSPSSFDEIFINLMEMKC